MSDMKDVGINTLIPHWKRQRERAHQIAMSGTIGPAAVLFPPAATQVELTGIAAKALTGNLRVAEELAVEIETNYPELLFSALVELGEKTPEGNIVLSVLPAYHWFVEELSRDPDAFYQLTSRQFEELIAGRDEREGWNVTLTPRSGDKGIDVIATRPDFGMIRIIDQVKLYKPHLVVDADEVRSLLGVLNEFERGASKCVLTTTSRFAPGVHKDFANVIPTRLWLRDYEYVRAWLLRDRAEHLSRGSTTARESEL